MTWDTTPRDSLKSTAAKPATSPSCGKKDGPDGNRQHPDFGRWSAGLLKPGQLNTRLAADHLGVSIEVLDKIRKEWDIGTKRKLRMPRSIVGYAHARPWRRAFWVFTARDFELLLAGWIHRQERNRRRRSMAHRKSGSSATAVPPPSSLLGHLAKRLTRARRLKRWQSPS
jgi:hypothetical protein